MVSIVDLGNYISVSYGPKTRLLQKPYQVTYDTDNQTISIRTDSYTDQWPYEDIVSPESGSISELAETLMDWLYLGEMDFDTLVASGSVNNVSVLNKWGYNLSVDSGASELIAPWGGVFDPKTDVMSTEQTYTISYNNTTDGSGQTGALALVFAHIGSGFLKATDIHVLGSTGSDVTSFTGYGINRIFVLSNGGAGWNVNNITVTATVDGTTQAQVPALRSVTQQPFYHTAIGDSLLIKKVKLNVQRIGSGTEPVVTFTGYSWSRVTQTRYDIFNEIVNTNVTNTAITAFDEDSLYIGGREVVYFEGISTRDGTVASVRLLGRQLPTP